MPQHPIYDIDIQNLSIAERVVLAQDLWGSLHHDAEHALLTPAEIRLIQDRERQADVPAVVWHTWDDVKREALSALHSPPSGH